MPHRTILITGASSGLGASIARRLSASENRVVVIGRSPKRTAALAAELCVDSHTVDFASFEQVRNLAAELRDKYRRIDVLFNNAGGMAGHELIRTVDGNEWTFQVDYLSHFLLTAMLFDNLKASKGVIICTSSLAARLSGMNGRCVPDDLNFTSGGYSALAAYSNAKLMMAMFAMELSKRYSEFGVTSASFHPGVVASNFASAAGGFIGRIFRFASAHALMRRIGRIVMPDEAADTPVWLSEEIQGGDLLSGEYYCRRRVRKTHSLLHDSAARAALWSISEKMTDVSFR